MDSSDDDFARAKRQGRAGRDSDDSDAGDFLGFGGSGRGRSGNDPILGVFADSSGDELGGPRRGKKKAAKGKGKRAKSPEVKPVAFRKGSTLPGQNVKLGETAAKPAAEDDLGVPASSQGPQLPTKTLASDENLSKTYGKGLNLLRKMGWQGGGLGSQQEGIANPIQVFQRKNRQGLQEEDEMQEQDLYGREGGRRGNRRSVEEIIGTPVADPSGNRGKAGGSFSSSVAPAPKRRRGGRTAEELAAELRKKLTEDEPTGMVIKDMRGSTVKVVNSLSGLLGEDEVAGKDDGSQRDMDLEGKVMMVVEKRRYYEDMLINVAIDIESLNAASSAFVTACSNVECGDAKQQQGAVTRLTLKQFAEKSGEDGALALLEAVQPSEEDPALFADWDDGQVDILCANINAAAGLLPAGFPMPPGGAPMTAALLKSSILQFACAQNPVQGSVAIGYTLGISCDELQYPAMCACLSGMHTLFAPLMVGLARPIAAWNIQRSAKDRRGQTVVEVSIEEGKQCRLVVAALEHLRELQDEGSITSQALADEVGKLRKQHPKAFKELRGFDVAIALAAPITQKELRDWDPLQDSITGLRPFAAWRRLIEDKDSKESVSNLIEAALLPRLRAAVSAWPVHDAEPCIGLLKACQESLPQEAVDALIEQVVVPRLRAAIEAWDPRVDKLPAHIWIHPWLPVLGDKLKVLWMPIRMKLAQQLADPQAKQLLQVWQQVLDPSNWEPLVAKLLSRLHDALAVVPVRPDGQNLGPFKDLFHWIGLLPVPGIANVLERGFFPQWQDALRNWLQQPNCDYMEVLKWYKGWRSFLPSEMLGQVTIRRQLAHGLQVMRSMMSNDARADMQGTEHEPPLDEPTERETEGAPVPPPAVEEVTLSVADYLAEIAGDQGLLFKPKNGASELGKQVYLFGAAQVYVEKGAVYAQGKAGKGTWRPVVHSELLFLAKGSGR